MRRAVLGRKYGIASIEANRALAIFSGVGYFLRRLSTLLQLSSLAIVVNSGNTRASTPTSRSA